MNCFATAFRLVTLSSGNVERVSLMRSSTRGSNLGMLWLNGTGKVEVRWFQLHIGGHLYAEREVCAGANVAPSQAFSRTP